MKKLLSLSLALALSGCAGLGIFEKKTMSLKVPEGGFSVVQHQREPEARHHNPLYLPSREVRESEFGSQRLKDFLAAMRATMHEKAGIGICANQVGRDIQAFLIEAKPDNPRYKSLGEVPFTVFLNPRITAASQERRNFWHGCLSAVGEKRGNVATYEWVEIEARDPDGKRFAGRLSGLAAVIFQHEFRHLLGGTYLDKAETFLDKPELDRKIDTGEVPFFGPAPASLPLLIGDYRLGETLEEYYARQKML